MKATEFKPGTIIKCTINCTETRNKIIYAIAPPPKAEINARLRTEDSDEGDLFGVATNFEVCACIGGMSNNFEEATFKEAAMIVNKLNRVPDLVFKVRHDIVKSQDKVRIMIIPDSLYFKGYKVYTRCFKPDELVLFRQHLSQNWTLAHYSHNADNIHFIQPGIPVHQILPYEGNEHLRGKKE